MKTYKHFLIGFVFYCFALPLKAQIGEPRSGFSIGVNAGIVLNRVSFDPTIKQNWYLGPTLGITARLMSEKYFSTYCALQAELNYSLLGWNENVLNSASQPLSDTYSRHLHYLQIPFLARLSWGREKTGCMGYFLVGPQVGFLLGESESRSNTWTLNSEGNPDRPNGLFAQYGKDIDRTVDYGITAGAGFELHLPKGDINFDVRYYYGLGDIYKNGKKDIFSRSNHGTIVAKVAYLFHIGKSDSDAR